MKLTLTIGLLICLFFSFSSMAAAEVLFGVTGEIGQADITADYSNVALTDISDSPNQFALAANLNLLGTHVDLTYGVADMDQSSLSTVDLRVGWELGLDILKAKAFGGYQYYLFSDDRTSTSIDSTYNSLVVGLGAESKFSHFTVSGSVLVPLATKFENSILGDDSDADLSQFEAGIAYAPVPFVDLFMKYRTFTAESKYLNLDSESYTLGVKVSF